MTSTSRNGSSRSAVRGPRSAIFSVVIALGSNLGNRHWYLRRAIEELRRVISVVRISPVLESEPVDAPPPRFLNMVVVGHTTHTPEQLLQALQEIESRLGRRRTMRNAPRVIDLDLILHSAHMQQSARLTLPHPRYLQREFVMRPLRALRLSWRDPRTGAPLGLSV
jgi:2-amino-4-hydroxy-6-hydroxymethyldihydropteridine diphosphokinase